MSHVLPLDGALDFEVERMRKRIAELESALRAIAKMEPTPVTAEFITGPQALLDACQRIARKALREPKQK